MKAVVLENRDGYTAVLAEDGTVRKIPGPCIVGETIELSDVMSLGEKRLSGQRKRTQHFQRIVRTVVIAAAVILVALLGAGGYYYTTDAAASIVVDAGGSLVTLYLNHFDRVIAFDVADETSETLLSSLREAGIRFNTVQDALTKVDAAIQMDHTDSTEQSPEVRIQTENTAAFERLRGQAEQSGFAVDPVPFRETDSTTPLSPATETAGPEPSVPAEQEHSAGNAPANRESTAPTSELSPSGSLPTEQVPENMGTEPGEQTRADDKGTMDAGDSGGEAGFTEPGDGISSGDPGGDPGMAAPDGMGRP